MPLNYVTPHAPTANFPLFIPIFLRSLDNQRVELFGVDGSFIDTNINYIWKWVFLVATAEKCLWGKVVGGNFNSSSYR